MRIRQRLLWVGLGLVGVASGCGAPDAPEVRAASVSGRSVGSIGVRNAVSTVAAAGSIAGSLDERGVPRLIIAATRQSAAPGATVDQAARAHLAHHAGGLGIGPATIDRLELTRTHVLDGGSVLTKLRQRVAGVEVFHGQVAVLMRANLDLISIAGQLEGGPVDRAPFALTPADALSGALTQHTGVALAASSVIDLQQPQGDYVRLQLDGGPLRLSEPARAKRVYFAGPGPERRLEPAWFVEFFLDGGGDPDAFLYLVSARDGRVLYRSNLTAYDTFDYRVWADPNNDHRPLDGPQVDFTPYPKPLPDGTEPAFILPNLITMEGFNHNPQGKADPWLPATATVSQGNNVDAYTDRNMPDGFSMGDFRASVTAPGVFDRTYDVTLEPTSSDPQAMAGIINAFYITNWMHDWWYDSGFDEAAGNGQQDNLGRGGMGGDPLHVECQDDVFGQGRNNSNMTTPADGMSPKMQLYVWDGPETHTLTLNPGGVVASAGATFGATNFNTTGAVVLVNDNTGTVTDGCEAIVNSVTGKIALIDRGICTFKQKVVNAQAAGAIGVIIADNKPANAPPTLQDGTPNTPVTIGAMAITLADGNTLKANLMAGAVTATMARMQEPTRDGTLDNAVVAHEWGHYLHHRLADCGGPQCSAMSEGWADYNALQMILRAGDDLNGTYAVAIYADQFQGDSAYYGIRRQPYTVDMSKNGLSFRHISNGQPLPNTLMQPTGGANSEVHNAGEVWATMMWEGYVALQQAGPMRMPPLSFDDVRRHMSGYVVAGLELTPADATYTEQRDAVLTAAAASSPDDLVLLAQAFARRGAGTCAISPPRDSMDFVGVVESNAVEPRIVVGDITVDDSVRSCDNDGALDADERGKLTVHLINGGPAPMMGATLTVATTTPGATFPLGMTANIPVIAPLAAATVALDIALDKSVATMGALTVDVTVASPGSCEGMVTLHPTWRINYDELPATSATDDVESDHSLWMPGGDQAAKIWSRVEEVPLNHFWHGADFGSVSDTWLESPDLDVNGTADFTISFSHRFRFETGMDQGQPANFDGAVIELSSDGGTTWNDVSMFAAPPYLGIITDVSGNPLALRNAFVGQNAAWPNREPVKLDLGQKLAGKTVRLRFRIGTDQAANTEGWDIDDIAFAGIDNKPFATDVDDRGMCKPATLLDGGADARDQATASGDGAEMPPVSSGGCGCTLGASRRGGDLAGLFLVGAMVALGALRRRARFGGATVRGPRHRK